MKICINKECKKPAVTRGYCNSHYARFMEKTNPKYKELAKARYKKWKDSARGKSFKCKPSNRYQESKSHAARRGVYFELTFEEWKDKALQPCTYCGKSFDGYRGVGLDRVDNSQGYTIDNVIPACGWCNKFRGDNVSVEEFKVMMDALIEHRTK